MREVEYLFDYIICDSITGVYSHKEVNLDQIQTAFHIEDLDIIARRLFSGKYAINEQPLYEGDIVKGGLSDKMQGLGVIVFEDSSFKIKWYDPTYITIRGKNPEILFPNSHIVWQKIGNIYENSNLLP